MLHRALALECLEGRSLLDGNGLLWPDVSRLTISFAPDGTDIAGQPSSLLGTLSNFDTSPWQSAVLRGFQTWAQHTRTDISLVPDDGSPFGVMGARTGDTRFGDIRVGAPLIRWGHGHFDVARRDDLRELGG